MFTMKRFTRQVVVTLALGLLVSPAAVRAHCDTLEGPVVTDARASLSQGDVAPVLKWVKVDDEPAVRAAFDRTLAVRQQSAQAAELADTWFFETLVRIHRAGEGAPYVGLTSGKSTEPGIEAADRAIVTGDAKELLAQTTIPLQAALKTKLERVRTLKAHAGHSVEAGRAYVEAYVGYVHLAERLARLGLDAPAASGPEHTH